jgi:very-short-patch-repair endonuclease
MNPHPRPFSQREKGVRNEYLKSEGFTIYRFENHEVLNKKEILLPTIEKIALSPLSLFPGRGVGGEGS